MNDSMVDSHFKITIKKLFNQKFPSNDTKAKKVIEHKDGVNDTEVFIFESNWGLIKAESVHYNILHENNYPCKTNPSNNVKKIKIIFQPRENKMYQSFYRILVKHGPAIEFSLKGVG